MSVAVVSALITSAVLHFSQNDGQSVSELQARIDQLEELINQEQAERLKLQQQIIQTATPNFDQKSQSVDEQSQAGPEENESTEPELADAQAVSDSQQFDQVFGQQRRAQNQTAARKRRLVRAGFAEAEANWLLKNESDVQLQTLYSDHEAQRAASQNNEDPPRVSAADQLRANIGDEFYERYLEANNRPTSVSVASILGSSPGEIAGLQAGDKIKSYAGERVFNVRDLNRLTVQGTAGESTLLEVERNGEPLQLTIPRGPVGINTRRR